MASTGFLRPSMISQNFPGKPTFTEKDIGDLSGKVYIVTGANTGVGKELSRILYGANSTVYMACRTESKARQAIDDIMAATPNSKGRLEFLHLDLGDLTTAKPAVKEFLSRESKLHVLFNNAGVMLPDPIKKTVQGYDMQLGTNCVGPFLFTELLTPTLAATASVEPANTVRVVWVSSMATELYSGRHGVDMANIKGKDYIKVPDLMSRYGNSKAGNYLHSVEYARRHTADGIISVAANPGNLDSDIYRTVGEQSIFQRLSLQMFTKAMLHPVVYGAYTELFAGLSSSVDISKSGSWIVPWGRFFNIRDDIAKYGKTKAEGGLGGAELFWKWSEEQVKSFM